MNYDFAREIGYGRYFFRRVLWQVAAPKFITLATGAIFPTPKSNFFALDSFLTEGNVDWNSEFILAAYLKKFGKEGDFLDVGAHIGYYSCLLAGLVRRVYAFEPDPRNVAPLQHALKTLSNAQHIDMAVSDRCGTIHLSIEDASSISHLVLEDGGGIEVKTTNLDQFVESRDVHPVAIKIDIEGFEILALKGATQITRAHAPVYLIEFNQDEGTPNTWQSLQEFLDGHGYHLFAMTRQKVGLMDYDYQFASFSTEEVRHLSTKMLFLVPASRVAWFKDISKEFHHVNGRSLRPSSVSSFLKKHQVL